MNISAVKVVVLVHAAAIAAVHRRRTHRAEDRMAAAMAMPMHRTSAHCRQHPAACLIQHQVSRYTDSKIPSFFLFATFHLFDYMCALRTCQIQRTYHVLINVSLFRYLLFI